MRNPLLEITPVVPEALGACRSWPEICSFSWHRPTRALFEDLDPELWKQTGGNPRLMLRCVTQARLERARAMSRTWRAIARRSKRSMPTCKVAPPADADDRWSAYFCAEYGFHESFPIYSGGLGVLAGDYCKAASDERANFVAVGLLYEQGYFTQTVDNDGVQHAEYRERDPRDLPVEPVAQASGEWMKVSVRIAGARCRRAPVEGAGRARAGLPARYQLRGERAVRP